MLYLLFVQCGSWYKGQSSDVMREVESEKTAGGEREQKETTPVAGEGGEEDRGRETGKAAPSPSDNVSPTIDTCANRWGLSPSYLHTQLVKGARLCLYYHSNHYCVPCYMATVFFSHSKSSR